MDTTQLLQNIGVVVSLVVAIIGVLISLAAFRRAGAADRRDQEAVLTIEVVWKGHRPPPDDPSASTSVGPISTWNAMPYPHEPDERWVLAVPFGEVPKDGVIVRQATDTDHHEKDIQNYATWRVLIAISNHGRAAAVDVRLRMLTTIGVFPDPEFREPDGPSVLDVQRVVSMPIIAVGCSEPRYVEIRSMASLPTRIEFLDATSGPEGKQPIRLSADPIAFHPRC
jgi:hypothetical protein